MTEHTAPQRTLPADVHSCQGVGSDADGWRIGCETCERRTLPPADPELAPMTPPAIIAFWCEGLIEPQRPQ